MIETALSVNGQDCTRGCGNTASEYEAMAVTLLRVAQATRDGQHGTIQCVNDSGRVLLSVIVHNRELDPDGAELEFPTIERFQCAEKERELTASFRSISSSMIDHYRLAKTENR